MQRLSLGAARGAARAVHTEARIASLGYKLPELPQPAGSYTLGVHAGYKFVNQGGWVYLAGHLPFKENMKDLHVGRIGAEYTVEEGSELAKTTGLELIASLKKAVGDLDKVKRIVKVNGFIAVADSTVTALPAVLNGCSDLLAEIFEERGVHARAAVGVVSLPLGGLFEIIAAAHRCVLPVPLPLPVHCSSASDVSLCFVECYVGCCAVPVEIDMVVEVDEN